MGATGSVSRVSTPSPLSYTEDAPPQGPLSYTEDAPPQGTTLSASASLDAAPLPPIFSTAFPSAGSTGTLARPAATAAAAASAATSLAPRKQHLGLEPQLAPAQQPMPQKLGKSLPSRSAVALRASSAASPAVAAPSGAAASPSGTSMDAAAAHSPSGARRSDPYSAAYPSSSPQSSQSPGEGEVVVFHPELGGFVTLSRESLRGMGVTIDSSHKGFYLPH